MKAIGLMSGTSVDGVDAALCDFDQAGQAHLLATHFLPYDNELKNRIHSLCSQENPPKDELRSVDSELVDRFSVAIKELLLKASTGADEVSVIGSHGQTIRHCPECREPYSLQIGDLEMIARKSGIQTVGDFRTADLEAGGQGAPLAPAFHNAVFRSKIINRVILNIGGIANITYLPADKSKPVTGFDTGPGNTLMDAWARKTLQKDYDSNGELAASGEIIPMLLKHLLDNDYFNKTPPKSTGRELFSSDWLDSQLASYEDTNTAADIAATLAELSVHTIVDAIEQYATDASEIYVCGGGAHNAFLLELLTKKLSGRRLATTEALGIGPDWVEAAAFAWLAKQTLEGLPGNLPEVTGADKELVLGRIVKP